MFQAHIHPLEGKSEAWKDLLDAENIPFREESDGSLMCEFPSKRESLFFFKGASIAIDTPMGHEGHYTGESIMGRPSQGRSIRLQAAITPEQMDWLEEQKNQHGDKSLSDAVFRLINEARQK